MFEISCALQGDDLIGSQSLQCLWCVTRTQDWHMIWNAHFLNSAYSSEMTNTDSQCSL